MRYSIPMKFIATMLTALALLAGFASIFGIVQVAQLGLYTDGFDGWVNNRLQWQAHDLAKNLTDRYAVRALTNCSDEVLEELGYWYVFEESIHWTGLEESSYDFSITSAGGQVLAEGTGLETEGSGYDFQTICSVKYPVLVTDKAVIDEIYGTEYLYRETVYPDAYDGKAVTIRYYESPQYTVNVTLDTSDAMARTGTSLTLIRLIYEQRYSLMILLAVSLVMLAAGMVYLCCAAGKTSASGKVKPAGINLLPLDIYAAAGGGAGFGLSMLAVEIINYWVFTLDNLNPGTIVLVGVVLLGVALICVGFIFAVAAQVKMKGLWWWNRTLLSKGLKKLWQGLCFLGKGVAVLSAMLPTMWKYILIGGTMGGLVALAVLLAAKEGAFWVLIPVVAFYVLILLYGGYAFGALLRGAEKMAAGDLNAKIENRFLFGSYRKCAQELNALADVAIDAAKKQMKSERMRTELITNVSHDIKTPLTSIINYVDILQSTDDPESSVQYLEVLSRQSQRLKRLIEDLMEMSKATTGNMHVDIIPMDPVETVNQALGEFSDKLADRDLTVVFNPPQQMPEIHADGRLTWRVLSNLLSNIVKYALPGTRVYVDILELDGEVLISLKNISREPLNVSAEELTERFVRGDTSRNTEGSGLGLNIAQSLMELQKGNLQLLVDGDLFKVTLTFPK